MELNSQIDAVDSSEKLADFVEALPYDLEQRRNEWENPTLEGFLEAMESWIGDAQPQTPSWKTVADILYAAKIYE